MKSFVKETLLTLASYLTEKYYSFTRRKLNLRPGTTDRSVFSSIFVLGELKLPFSINPRLIIDGGAYTGLSSLYYAFKYPHAKIIAIEPEDSNFKILAAHAATVPNIVPVHAGLWHRTAFLKIVDRKMGKWGFMVKESKKSDGPGVRAVTIEDTLNQSGCNVIDILKLDIEGSEKEIFSKNYLPWIGRVNVIVIELHDRYRKGCKDAVLSAIDVQEWRIYERGEKMIFARKKMLI